MPDIADDADDFVRFLVQQIYPKVLSEGILIGEVAPSQLLADYHDLGAVIHLSLGERAPENQGDAHRAKILVIDTSNIGEPTLREILSGAAVDVERRIRGLAGKWKLGDQPDCLYPRQCRHALLQLVEESGLALWLGIGIRDIYPHRQQVAFIKPGPHSLEPDEAVDEQTRPDQQDD